MNSFLSGIKNVLLWSHARGTWQYDVFCLLIVAVIFLLPSRFFGDRDRSPAVQANFADQIASKRVMISRDIVQIELKAFLEKENKIDLMSWPEEAIALYLKDQLKRDVKDLRYEPIVTVQGRAGYRVWFN